MTLFTKIMIKINEYFKFVSQNQWQMIHVCSIWQVHSIGSVAVPAGVQKLTLPLLHALHRWHSAGEKVDAKKRNVFVECSRMRIVVFLYLSIIPVRCGQWNLYLNAYEIWHWKHVPLALYPHFYQHLEW